MTYNINEQELKKSNPKLYSFLFHGEPREKLAPKKCLIVKNQLDEETAKEVLIAQLGKKYDGLTQMSKIHQKAVLYLFEHMKIYGFDRKVLLMRLAKKHAYDWTILYALIYEARKKYALPLCESLADAFSYDKKLMDLYLQHSTHFVRFSVIGVVSHYMLEQFSEKRQAEPNTKLGVDAIKVALKNLSNPETLN